MLERDVLPASAGSTLASCRWNSESIVAAAHETLFLGMTAASKAGKMNHEMSK
jgi:hypothetical protein